MAKQPKHANSGRPDAAKIAPFSTLERGNAAEQIAGEIHRQILNGRLSRGSRLPTEKQLASGYGVSNPTIREAIRSLATMRLIEVRHGSGAYVTADADQLLAVSLNFLIPLERMGVEDLLGTLGALNAHAAELAAANATKRDIEEMQHNLYINDFKFWFDAEDQKRVEKNNEKFLVMTPEEVKILETLSPNPLDDEKNNKMVDFHTSKINKNKYGSKIFSPGEGCYHL